MQSFFHSKLSFEIYKIKNYSMQHLYYQFILIAFIEAWQYPFSLTTKHDIKLTV